MSDSASPLDFLLNSPYGDKFPRLLAARFPHVAAELAKRWHDAPAMADYLNELLIPSRPNRQGFPPDVAAEIMRLSLAYDQIGHLVQAEATPPKAPTGGTYHWDQEALIDEIERYGFPFTRQGFVKAIEAGHQEAVSRFLEAGFNVDIRDAREWTPLMIAAFYGRESLALRLIECGADIFAKDSGGYSSLHWAAFSGFVGVVRLLLERGMPANVLSNSGISPLLQASARGHVAIIQELLAHQANPNLVANDGASPLLKAVANGRYEACILLVNAGASAFVTLRDGTTLDDLLDKCKDARIRALFA